MNGSLGNGAALGRAGDWADKARGMLASFPTSAAKEAAALIVACYERGGKVLACGNGGSAAEAQHLVTELVGKFERERAPLPALALDANSATLTAVANDYGYDEAFAHQVDALGEAGDVLVAISTSGDSENAVRAVLAAKEKGLATVGYLGEKRRGGRLGRLVDVPVVLGARDTATVQAGHLVLTTLFAGSSRRRSSRTRRSSCIGTGPSSSTGTTGRTPMGSNSSTAWSKVSSSCARPDTSWSWSRTSPGWPAATSTKRRSPGCTTGSRGCSTGTGRRLTG